MPLAKAGIDPAAWDPTLGFAANEANVYAVYDYYSSLYLSDPEKFWWAGMASMIGPSFVAGMTDLSDAGLITEHHRKARRDGGHDAGDPRHRSATSPASPLPSSQEELEFYETRLLLMQKEIFLDMAVAHEAYLDGGMDTIERLYANDPYLAGASAVDAWRRIDRGAATGNTELVAEGNRDLLLREQLNVIDDDYRRMKQRPVTGEAFTYVFTAAGSTVDPRCQRLRRGVPDQCRGACQHRRRAGRVAPGRPAARRGRGRGGHRHAAYRTGTSPTSTTAGRSSRRTPSRPTSSWSNNDPDEAARILSTPVADRVEEWRIVHRIDDIATNWEPYVDVDVEADGSVFSAVGDGVSSAWDWAFGGSDAPDSGPVEVPTGTRRPRRRLCPRLPRRRAAAARRTLGDRDRRAGTVPTTVPGG